MTQTLNNTDLKALELAMVAGSIRFDDACFPSEIAATRCLNKLWKRLDYLTIDIDDDGEWFWKASPMGKAAYRSETGNWHIGREG